MCETAKEIWDELCEYFDGDEACKSNKLYNCILAFDTFKKDAKESLRDCQNRFTKVLNDCRALGKIYTVKEVNMRFLSCLGAAWHIKITSLKDSKDLNVMSLKNLVSNLTTYESELKQLLEPDKYIKTLSLKAQSESSVRITSLSDDSESEEDENAFMARKFPKYRKFYKSFKSKQNQQSSSFQRTPKRPLLKASSSSSSKTPSDDLLCFNCRKPGHFSSKCPMPTPFKDYQIPNFLLPPNHHQIPNFLLPPKSPPIINFSFSLPSPVLSPSQITSGNNGGGSGK